MPKRVTTKEIPKRELRVYHVTGILKGDPRRCYNKRNPKKGIERNKRINKLQAALIEKVTTKEIPKRELRGGSLDKIGARHHRVTTKEIPKRELRDFPHTRQSGARICGVTTKEIPKRELRAAPGGS